MEKKMTINDKKKRSKPVWSAIILILIMGILFLIVMYKYQLRINELKQENAKLCDLNGMLTNLTDGLVDLNNQFQDAYFPKEKIIYLNHVPKLDCSRGLE